MKVKELFESYGRSHALWTEVRPLNLGYDWKMDIFSPKSLGRDYGQWFVSPEYILHSIGDESVVFSNNGVHFGIKYESTAQLKKILSKMKNKGGKDHQGTPWKKYLNPIG